MGGRITILTGPASSIPTPAAGKVTLFVDENGVFRWKDEDGIIGDIGVGQQTYLHELAADKSVTSPGFVTIDSGQFTPQATEAIVDVNVGASFLEAAGGWGSVQFLASQTVAFPLNSREQDTIKPGVTEQIVGAIGSYTDVIHRPVKLTGLTPGLPVRWELCVGVVGGFHPLALSETPIAVASSYSLTPTFEDAQIGDTIVALRGPTKLMVVRYNAFAGGSVVAELVGEVNLPSATGGVAITPNGRYITVVNTGADSVSLIDINTMGHVAGSPFAAPAGAGLTGIANLGNALAGVVGGTNGNFYGFGIPGGAFGAPVALGGTTAPTKLAAGVNLTRALVICPGTDEVVQLNLQTGAIMERYSVDDPVAAAYHAFNVKAYVVNDVGRIFEIDSTAETIDAGVVPSTDNPFVPTDLQVFSDGHTALMVGNDSGALRQVVHVNLPERTTYTEWSNQPSGSDPKVNAPAVAFGIHGSIFIPYTTGLNIWPGGMFQCRPLTFEAFEGEFAQVLVRGASA